MFSVSEKYSKAIIADSRNMLYRVTLAGAIVLDQSKVTNMTLTESASDNSGVSIGTSNSASLKLTLKNADAINYNGIMVEPESGLVLPDGSIEWIPLGKFWVTNFATSDDYATVTLECADGMYHMTDEYISELTYPTSLKSVVSEIVAKTGVIFVSSLPEIEMRVKPEGMTYRDAIGHLAGCCGCNARFNRLGQLEFFWYEDCGVKIERNTQYLNGLKKLNDKPLDVNFEVVGKQELYSVTCVAGDNGGITATPGQNVIEGETVVVSINPFLGYELADISAVTDAGDAVTLYMDSEGGRTFVQPDSNVTITASFRTSADGPFKLTVRTDDNGTIRANKSEYDEGEIATVYICPYDGYEFDRFTTIPTGITFTRIGTASSGEEIYDFAIPKSDVTVTAVYKKSVVAHTITAYVDESEFTSPGYLFVEDTFTGEFPLRSAVAGTLVSVTYSPLKGYEFDYFDSSVTLTQVGTSTYNFIMPDEDVSIVVHYKLSEDKSKTGMYSWLALPEHNTPPTSKPYWAVFYGEDKSVPTCKKFWLIWFDSWTVTKKQTDYYSLKFDGYYYCKSQNTGHLPHAWDTSRWFGNGASSSTFSFVMNIGKSSSSEYCLLASNVHLFYNSQLLFEKCENAIQFPQTGYVVDGVDVREKGSLTNFKCPDTFSTPLPARKWMIVNTDGALCMTPDEDGSGYSSSDSREGLWIVFFDDILIENIGTVFDSSTEEFYIATVTNGHCARIMGEDSSTSWVLYDIADGDVIGLRSPLYGCYGASDFLGRCYFSGVVATNSDLWSSGNLFMYRNDCRICDCATATDVEPISTFSLRNTQRAVDAESVTMTYENPLIYEKMVDTISSLVQGVTYTPVKVKHRGNPAFQVGDIVQAPDKDGVYHTVLIMQQTMNFGGGMNSEITSPGQTKKTKSFSSNSPTTAKIKKEVKASTLDLERRMAESNALVYAALYKTIGMSEAKIKSLAEWQTATSATIASLEETASEHEASIELHARYISDNADSIANIFQRVTESESEIELLTEWKGTASASIASISSKADANSANIGLLVENGNVKGSVVVEAINNDESVVRLTGDRLVVDSENFKLDESGNVEISGKVTAEEGFLGGWNIAGGGITKTFSENNETYTVNIQAVKYEDFDLSETYVFDVSDAAGARFYITAKGDMASIGDEYTTQIHYGELQLTQRGAVKTSAHFNSYEFFLDRDTSGNSSTLQKSSLLIRNNLIQFYSYNGVTRAGASIQHNGAGTAVLKGTWNDNSGIAVTSDANLKHDIEPLDERYSVFFDSLIPRRFKYNDGTSGRYHSGYVTQEVQEALKSAGITESEFAGIVTFGQRTEDEYSALRYSEFISLNTYEIQKLKARVAELEAKIGG